MRRTEDMDVRSDSREHKDVRRDTDLGASGRLKKSPDLQFSKLIRCAGRTCITGGYGCWVSSL